MEPLKKETRESILKNRPRVQPEDIDEYEKLLSERFRVNPNVSAAPEASRAYQQGESRLRELYEKLFGTDTQAR